MCCESNAWRDCQVRPKLLAQLPMKGTSPRSWCFKIFLSKSLVICSYFVSVRSTQYKPAVLFLHITTKPRIVFLFCVSILPFRFSWSTYERFVDTFLMLTRWVRILLLFNNFIAMIIIIIIIIIDYYYYHYYSPLLMCNVFSLWSC